MAFDIGTKVAKLSDPIAWENGEQYFIRINTNDGTVSNELAIKSPRLADAITT